MWLNGLGSSIFDGITDNVYHNNIYSNDLPGDLIVLTGSPSIDIRLPQGKYYHSYLGSAGFRIPMGKTLIIEPGVTLYPHSKIEVAGTLIINGTKQKPVVISTYTDPIYGFKNPTFYQPMWEGITVQSTGSINANNLILRDCFNSQQSMDCGIYVEGMLQLLNSEISHRASDALTINAVAVYLNTDIQPVINFNTFYNNRYGVYNLKAPSMTVDVEYNYWGSASGPGSTYNRVSDGVDYIPWLGQEFKYEINFGTPGVNAPSGNYSKSFIDMSLKTAGYDVSLSRTYNSGDDSEGSILGKGWTFGFQGSIAEVVPSAGIYRVKMPNGSSAIFYKNTDGSFKSGYSHDSLEQIPSGEFVLTTKEQLQYGYNTSGKLIWLKDRNNNTITINYDSQGRIQSITDAAGRSFTLGYSNGLLASITDPMGQAHTYEYENGFLVRSIDRMGNITRYSYDSDGLLTEIKDHDFNLIEGVTYFQEAGENKGKVNQLTNQLGNIITYSYDTVNKKTTMTDSNNRITFQSYDDNFFVTTSRDAEGKETRIEYFKDSSGVNYYGDIKSVTDRNGNKTQYEIDTNGNITKQINPDGSSRNMTYDSKNNMTSLKDEIGNTAYYIYDSDMKNLIKEVKPLNGTDIYTGENDSEFAITKYAYYSEDECSQFGYSVKGLIKSVTNPENETEHRTYDAYGNLKSVSDPETGLLKSYEYDILGNKTAEISPSGYRTMFIYNPLGKTEKTVTHNNECTRWVYDSNGSLVKEVLPNQYNPDDDDILNHQYHGDYGSRWIYNPNGTLQAVIDPENYITSYTYDVYGNKLTETMPNGSIYRYEYDEMNRLTGTWFKEDEASSETQLNKYTYEILTDGKTRETQNVYLNDSEEAVTVVLYDKNGREIQTTQPDGTILATGYLLNGLVATTTDAAGNKTYNRYDGLNRLSEQWVPFSIENGITQYSYKKLSYDRAGRQIQELKGKESVPLYGIPNSYAAKSMQYYKNGLIKATLDSDGRKTEFFYDTDGVLCKEDTYTDTNTKNTIEYVNNHLGKPLQKKVLVRRGDMFGYSSDDDGLTYLITSFTYDKNGNLKTLTTPNDVMTTFEYDNKNQLLSSSYTGEDEFGEPAVISNSQALDWQGKPISQIDANGNQMTHIYDKRGNLIRTEYPDKSTSAFWYDRAGRKTAEVLPNHYTSGKLLEEMNRKQYIYDRMGRILVAQDIWFNEKTSQWETITSEGYLYDKNGNVTKKLNALGYEAGRGATHNDIASAGYGVVYTYNLANLCMTELDAVSKEKGLSFTVKNTYNALGQKIAEEDANGVKKYYTVNDNGLLVQEKIQAPNSTETKTLQTNTWDLAGNLLSQTDSNGNTESYSYTSFNKIRRFEQPGDYSIAANTVIHQYDKNLNLVMKQNSIGEMDLYSFNHVGQLTEETRQKASGGDAVTLTHAYDRNGNLRFDTDGNGNKLSYTYDGLNRMLSKAITVGGASHTTAYSWDKNGNSISEMDWLGNTWIKDYDALNRLTDRYDPNGVCIEHLEYNKNHLQVSSTDAFNHTTTYAYDRNNRLITTTDAASHVTEQKWDNMGYLSQKKDGKGNATSYLYDAQGHLIKVTNAKGEVTEYIYDLEGNLLTQIDGNNHAMTVEYNVRNLPVRRIDHGGRTGTEGAYSYASSKVETYAYDAVGRKISTIDRNGILTTWQYDSHNHILSETADDDSIIYTYDANGNVLSMADDTGTTIYTYDELNRILSKNVPNIGVLTNKWDITEGLPDGFYKHRITDPRGNVSEKVYDKSGRLHQVTSASNSATYNYFDNGSCRSVVYDNGCREDYTYTADNLLETLTNKGSDGSVINSYTYTYDAAHNQTSKTDAKGLTLYTYDALNRLLSVTEPGGKATSYTYDGAGNRLKQTVVDGSTTTTDESIYNEQNRLTSLTTKTNGVISETRIYSYDSNGNLLSTTVNGQGTAENTYDSRNQLVMSSSGGVVTKNRYNGEGYRVSKETGGQLEHYLYDGSRVILELDTNGNTQGRNIYGINLVLREADNQMLYYMYNGHADVTALISNYGQVVGIYDYDPFGNIIEHTGTDSPYTYAGYRYDTETELYYLNARMYDPKIARFLQEDTYRGDLKDPLSLNLYVYCENNPLIYFDPTGHFLEGVGKWFSDAYNIAKNAVVGYGSSAVNTVIGLEEAFIYRPLAAAADLVGWQDAGNYIRSNVSQAKSTVNTAMESMVTDMQIYQTAKAGMDTAQLVYGVGSLAKSAYQAAMSYEKVANVVAKVEAKANAAIQKVSQNVMKAANKVMDDVAAAGNKFLTNQGGYIKFPGKAKQIESSVAKGMVNSADDIAKGTADSEKVLFGQKSVSPNFSAKGSLSGASIESIAQKLKVGEISPDALPIEYIVRNGKMITLNNRSLTALSKAGMQPTQLINKTGNAFLEKQLTERLAEMGGQPSTTMYIRKLGEIISIP